MQTADTNGTRSMHVRTRRGTTDKSIRTSPGDIVDVSPLCDEQGVCYLDGYLATTTEPHEWREIDPPIDTAGIRSYAFVNEIPEGISKGDLFRPRNANGPWKREKVIKDETVASAPVRFFEAKRHTMPLSRLEAAGDTLVSEDFASYDVLIRLDDGFNADERLDDPHGDKVALRLDITSQAPKIVHRPPTETLGAFLRQVPRRLPGSAIHVHCNRKVRDVQNAEDAQLHQLRGVTLEVTCIPAAVSSSQSDDTIIEQTVASSSKEKALHTTDENDRRGKALNETERRQIMHMLDLAEFHRTEAIKNKTRVPADKKLSYRKIAELTGKHHNTIAKLKKQRDTQACRREQDDRTGIVRTLDAPIAGKQGGFRWCRLNDEQKQLCTRIAIEDPKLTTTQIRTRIQDAHPELTTLSDSTVWRVLHDSNLQFLRAKMKDPKSEGTQAHKDEMAAFLKEQQKGEEGQLGALNLFFMDEALVNLNETMNYTWGTTSRPGIIKQAKGKTETIGLHAGLGLVSNHFGADDWANIKKRLEKELGVVDKYAPRGNHMSLRGGVWEISPDAPKFMLFWMMRPPGRREDALPRFIDRNDILDANFTLFLPTFNSTTDSIEDAVVLEAHDVDSTRHNQPTASGWNKLCKKSGKVLPYQYETTFYKFNDEADVRLIKDGKFEPSQVKKFCEYDFDVIRNIDLMAKILWLNNIEWRQVDNDGEILTLSSVNVTRAYKVWCTIERMHEYLKALRALIARTVCQYYTPVTDNDPDDLCEQLSRYDVDMDDVHIPRAYHGKLSRNTLGGKIESKRGDRSNFLRYLLKHNEYMLQSFPTEDVHDNLVEVWDSAPDHGTVEITKQDKSFLHDWVQRYLGIKGCVFTPARSPDFNPTELLFSFIKGVVRRRFPGHTGEITVDEMIRLIDEAFQEVTEEMIKGWLRFGCYRIPNDPKMALVEKNDRCGYNHTPPIDVWQDLIAEWERRNNFSIDSATRVQLVAANFASDATEKFDTARIALCGRFRRAYDIFGQTEHPIQKVYIGPPYLRLEIVFGKDIHKLNANIQLDHPIEIHYQSPHIPPVKFADNYKSNFFKRFDHEVLQLREDASGFRVLHAYTHMKEQMSGRTQTAIDTLNDLYLGNTGLLYSLTRARSQALEIASIISPHLMHSPSITTDDMLLDVQERVFHAKLDGKKPKLKMTPNGATCIFERVDTSASTRRTLPIRMCLKTPATGLEESDDVTVDKIESLVVVMSVAGTPTPVQFGNRRIVDAVFECDDNSERKKETRAKLDRLMTGIERELLDGPYSASIPEASTPARPFAMATIALRAYNFERQRMMELLTEGMRKYHGTSDDTTRADIFEDCIRRWQRRTSVGAIGVTDEGERTTNGGVNVLNSSSQAPLLLISNMRSERRSSVQLKMLARTDAGDRRYPGYPIEESDERNGKPYKVHAPSDSHKPPDPVRNVNIERIVRRVAGVKDSAEEIVIGTIVMQNGKAEKIGRILSREFTEAEAKKELVSISKAIFDELRQEDTITFGANQYFLRVNQRLYDEQYRRFFGSYARENLLILNLAKKRYYENNSKSNKKDKMTNDADVVVGIIDKVALRYEYTPKTGYRTQTTRTGSQADRSGKPVYVNADRHVLFDPVRNTLYPSIFQTVRATRSNNQNDSLVVGIVDRDVLMRRKMATTWRRITKDSQNLLYNKLEEICDIEGGALCSGTAVVVCENHFEKDKEDDQLYRCTNPPEQTHLIYRLTGGAFMIPAWRKGKLAQKLRNGAVHHLIKPHSLSVSIPNTLFYNLTQNLYRVPIDKDKFDALKQLFVQDAAPQKLHLEDRMEIVVTLYRFAGRALVVYTENNIVIRRKHMKDIIESYSLLQLQSWNSAGELAFFSRDEIKECFAVDEAQYDIITVANKNVLRLL